MSGSKPINPIVLPGRPFGSPKIFLPRMKGKAVRVHPAQVQGYEAGTGRMAPSAELGSKKIAPATMG